MFSGRFNNARVSLWLLPVIVFAFFESPLLVLAQSFETVTELLDPVAFDVEAGAVEVPRLRTEKTVTFRLPNGSFTAVSSGQEIFTHNEHGDLVRISEVGMKTNEGILFSRLPRDAHVIFDLSRPSYTYSAGGHFFRLSYTGAAVATLDGDNVVRYQLAEHAILRFTIHGASIQKTITIDGPVDPALLHFTISQDPTLIQHSSSGGLTLDTAKRKTVFRTLAPSLLDASGKILHHPISLTLLGNGTYAYSYDPTGLPSTYIIDPTTCFDSFGYPQISQEAFWISGSSSWSNLSGAQRLDGNSATAVDTGATQYLEAKSFNFFIPYSVVDGIKAYVWKSSSDPTFTADQSVLLVVDGAVATGGTDKASADAWSSTITMQTYGGVADLWGLTPTWRQVNSNGFGLAFSAIPSLLGITMSVDAIRMQITYHIRCRDPNSSTGQLITPTSGQSYGGFACTYWDSATSLTNYPDTGTGASMCNFNKCWLTPMIGTGSLPATVHAYSDSYVWSGGSYTPMQIDGLNYGWGWYRWWDHYYNGGTWDGYWGSFWSNPWGSFGNWNGWWGWWGWWWGGWYDNVKFRKGGYSGTKIADVPMQFYNMCDGSGYSWWTDYNDNVIADTSGQSSVFHINADTYNYRGSGMTYTLYVPKSVSHDRVRICVDKTTLGCTSSDTWSFLANDAGTIIATNGGFDTTGYGVSVSGGYWIITGVSGTGAQGEDSGTGGTSVPEFSTIGLMTVLGICGYVMRRKILKGAHR